jgi:hypothetical protein
MFFCTWLAGWAGLYVLFVFVCLCIGSGTVVLREQLWEHFEGYWKD